VKEEATNEETSTYFLPYLLKAANDLGYLILFIGFADFDFNMGGGPTTLLQMPRDPNASPPAEPRSTKGKGKQREHSPVLSPPPKRARKTKTMPADSSSKAEAAEPKVSVLSSYLWSFY
jgi:hypothetical protein